jgi:hypothetical protein
MKIEVDSCNVKIKKPMGTMGGLCGPLNMGMGENTLLITTTDDATQKILGDAVFDMNDPLASYKTELDIHDDVDDKVMRFRGAWVTRHDPMNNEYELSFDILNVLEQTVTIKDVIITLSPDMLSMREEKVHRVTFEDNVSDKKYSLQKVFEFDEISQIFKKEYKAEKQEARDFFKRLLNDGYKYE